MFNNTHLLDDVQYLNNFIYPPSYLWAYWDGWGYVVDVVINNAVQARCSLKEVPEQFRSLPVIKNLDYIEVPEWANVVYIENQSKQCEQSNASVKWTCHLCGRNKFDRKYQPHNCVGGFRKSFKMPKNKLSNFDIYKMYKHGELANYNGSMLQLYKALKENLLQVFLVKDFNDEEHVFNYIPEINQFEMVL